jgi:hypothetical protein
LTGPWWWCDQAADDAKFMPSLVEATFLPWDVHPRKAKEIMMLQRFVFAVRKNTLVPWWCFNCALKKQ